MIYSLFAEKINTGVEDCIYSVDMLRFSFKINENMLSSFKSHYEKLLRCDCPGYLVDEMPLSFAKLKFKHIIKFTNTDNNSFILGYHFNGFDFNDKYRGFLEFNPNKVLVDVLDEFIFLRSICKSIEIKRADIAFDFNINRKYCKLIRTDNKIYSNIFQSDENFTEYLGNRNSNGFVKVYNKTNELRETRDITINQDVTRIEITLDFPFDNISVFPFVALTNRFLYSKSDLSDNECAFLDLLLHSGADFNYFFNKLTYHTRRKILNSFEIKKVYLGIDQDLYNKIVLDLQHNLANFFSNDIINYVSNKELIKTLRKTLDFTNSSFFYNSL